MINLILAGPGGNLIDRALCSVLSSYGLEWGARELGALTPWQLDELLFEAENLILRKCGLSALKSFTEEYMEFLKERSICCWLPMPPTVRDWSAIGLAVSNAQQQLPSLQYCFLLSREFDRAVWQKVLAQAEPEVLDLMTSKTAMLPDFDLRRLAYTTSAGGTEVCLVMPRADRQTAKQAGELLGLVIDRLPLSAFL